MAKYRVLRGRHAHGKDKNGSQIVYGPGDIVETDVDLTKLNAVGPKLSRKFEKVADGVSPTKKAEGSPTVRAGAPDDNLDSMTVSELRQFAEEEEIDLSSVPQNARKEVLVQRIRSRLSS